MEVTKTIQMCSKCGNHPRAFPDSNNPWCRECLTTYQASYVADRKAREKSLANGQGFSAGAEVMRQELLAGLGRMAPMGMLRVKETSDWIASFPTPRPQ